MVLSLRPLPEATFPDPAQSGGYVASRRSRPVALALSLGVAALILFALLTMAVIEDRGKSGGSILTAISLSPPPGEKSPNPRQARAAPKVATMPHQQTVNAAPKLPPHIDVNNPDKVEWPEGFVHMSRAELAASDISRIRSAPSSAQGDADASAGGGGRGGGQGPDADGFYRAEWYRKPPRNALDSYMRPGQNPGRWAEIGCRMIENFRVDDCHELAEEPRGSGMARVLREASWQFLVRPPRQGGKALIGEHVRIHYDFTTHEVAQSPAGEAP